MESIVLRMEASEDSDWLDTLAAGLRDTLTEIEATHGLNTSLKKTFYYLAACRA